MLISIQIHPVHQAYFNFYLALSHDTMAREAGKRNRYVELDLAEKHYLAAITALTAPEPQKLDDIQETHSLTSSEGDTGPGRRRSSDTASLDSTNSISTAATSVGGEETEVSTRKPVVKRSVSFEARRALYENGISSKTTISNAGKRRPSSMKTAPLELRSSHVEENHSLEVSSFISMVKVHLASIRELKNRPVGPMRRFSVSRSRSSTMSSASEGRDSTHDDVELERTRWDRKSVSFRPRFDPTSVRKLCSDALNEL